MRIKRLNEYFSQQSLGDGFNSSNGVFKVSYKPYADLAIVKGRDAFSDAVAGEEINIGDHVKGLVLRNPKKEIAGEVVKKWKSENDSHYEFSVKSISNNKVYRIVPSSIELIKSSGYTNNTLGANVAAGEVVSNAMAQGQRIWGSYESLEPEAVLQDTKPEEVNEEEYILTIINNSSDALKSSEYSNTPDYNKCVDYISIQKMKSENNWETAKKIIHNFLVKNKESYGHFSDRMGESLKKFIGGSKSPIPNTVVEEA